MEEERMELSHEAQPGYPRYFLIAVIVSAVYLAVIFAKALF